MVHPFDLEKNEDKDQKVQQLLLHAAAADSNDSNEIDPPLQTPQQQQPPPTYHLLEMSLTRNLCILPSDVVDVAAESAVAASNKRAHMENNNNVLPPFVLFDLSWAQWLKFVWTACYSAMCICFVWALRYTTVGNVVIFANPQALIFLVTRVCFGASVAATQSLGALVAFAGAIMCSYDSSSSSGGRSSNADLANSEQFPSEINSVVVPADDNAVHARSDNDAVWRSVLGDAFSFSAALFGVSYLVCAKTIRPYVPLYPFMCVIMWLVRCRPFL